VRNKNQLFLPWPTPWLAATVRVLQKRVDDLEKQLHVRSAMCLDELVPDRRTRKYESSVPGFVPLFPPGVHHGRHQSAVHHLHRYPPGVLSAGPMQCVGSSVHAEAVLRDFVLPGEVKFCDPVPSECDGLGISFEYWKFPEENLEGILSDSDTDGKASTLIEEDLDSEVYDNDDNDSPLDQFYVKQYHFRQLHRNQHSHLPVLRPCLMHQLVLLRFQLQPLLLLPLVQLRSMMLMMRTT